MQYYQHAINIDEKGIKHWYRCLSLTTVQFLIRILKLKRKTKAVIRISVYRRRTDNTMGKRKKVQKDKQRSTNSYIFVSCFLVFSIVNSRTISHDIQRGGGARWRHIIHYFQLQNIQDIIIKLTYSHSNSKIKDFYWRRIIQVPYWAKLLVHHHIFW
jgi:hypothetical protein